jgi:predicted DNA-binding helix-hairpin-helix protein
VPPSVASVIVAGAAKYDASCGSSGAPKRAAGRGGLGSTTGSGICHAYTPDGRCVSLLKILQTNWCINECAYCVDCRSSNAPLARFTVDADAGVLQAQLHRGLLLSSGVVKPPDHTTEQPLLVARKLRRDEGFAGHVTQDHPRGVALADRAGRPLVRWPLRRGCALAAREHTTITPRASRV